MKRKVGKQFKYGDKILKILEDLDCNCFKCFFYNESVLTCRKMKYADYERSECDNVYFVEV